MNETEFCSRNCCEKSMKNILLMGTIDLRMMYFKKLAGCFHTIWRINAANLQESDPKPANITTMLPEKRA